HGIDPDDGGDAIADAFERTRRREASIGMGDEANVGEVFPLHQVAHVRYVRVEIGVLAEQMRAITEPGKCRRIYFVPGLLEPVRNATPVPSSARGPGNQEKRLARRLSTRLADQPGWRNNCGGARSSRKNTNACASRDVWQTH